MHRAPRFTALVVLLGACTVVSPSPSPGSSRATESASPEPTPALSSPPTVETLPPGSLSGTIDQKFTTPALEYRSTGSLLIWSSAARADHDADTAPDLFASEPGGSATLLYDNPHRDSRLELIGGDAGRVVFVEDNVRVFGQGHWKLWYIASLSESAQLIEEGAGNLPFFDLSGARLVWTVNGAASESELWSLDLETMQRHLLQSAAVDRTQYWFPSIDGHLVVYGTLEHAEDGTEARHIYLIDMDGDGRPRRLDASASMATGPSMPAIRGATVVWKESSLTESHVVGGSLVRYSLDSGETVSLTLDPSTPGYTFPTIGDRYIAAWSQSDRALYLGDLETRSPLRIVDLGPTDIDNHENVGQISDLSGSLLAYFYGPPNNADLELKWAVLP